GVPGGGELGRDGRLDLDDPVAIGDRQLVVARCVRQDRLPGGAAATGWDGGHRGLADRDRDCRRVGHLPAQDRAWLKRLIKGDRAAVLVFPCRRRSDIAGGWAEEDVE